MMRKFWIAALAVMLFAQPGVAQAQDGEKLDCVMVSATPELKTSMGKAMEALGRGADMPGLIRQLRAVTDACATKWDFDPDLYFNYSIGRLAREWITPVLRRASVDTATVDRFYDFGPGRANPEVTTVTPEQAKSISEALQADGVDVEKIGIETWEVMGVYIGATSIYWRSRALLTR